MESIRKEKEVLSRRGSARNSVGNRLGVWLVVLATTCCVAGCTTIKKAGVTAIATGTAVTAATVLSGGATAPILAGTTTAFVADAATEVMMSDKKRGTVLQTEQGMIECAPDNFFTLWGKLVEMGGWLLVLIFVVPMILGWILPGPVTTHGKNRKDRNLFS